MLLFLRDPREEGKAHRLVCGCCRDRKATFRIAQALVGGLPMHRDVVVNLRLYASFRWLVALRVSLGETGDKVMMNVVFASFVARLCRDIRLFPQEF